jgi:hypothetical protein
MLMGTQTDQDVKVEVRKEVRPEEVDLTTELFGNVQVSPRPTSPAEEPA